MIIIPTGFFGDESWFEYLKNVNAYDVLVLTQEYVHIVKKKIKREITNTVNRALIIRAMETSSHLR